MRSLLEQRKHRLQETPAWMGGRDYESIRCPNRAKSANHGLVNFISPRISNRCKSSAEAASRIREVYHRSNPLNLTRTLNHFMDHAPAAASAHAEDRKRNRPQTSRPSRSDHAEQQHLDQRRSRPFTAGTSSSELAQRLRKSLHSTSQEAQGRTLAM